MLHPLLVSPALAAQSRGSARKAVDTADGGFGAAVACLQTGRFVPVPTPQGADRSGSRLYLCKDSSGLLSPQDPPYPVIACSGPMACSPTGESKAPLTSLFGAQASSSRAEWSEWPAVRTSWS